MLNENFEQVLEVNSFKPLQLARCSTAQSNAANWGNKFNAICSSTRKKTRRVLFTRFIGNICQERGNVSESNPDVFWKLESRFAFRYCWGINYEMPINNFAVQRETYSRTASNYGNFVSPLYEGSKCFQWVNIFRFRTEGNSIEKFFFSTASKINFQYVFRWCWYF